MRPTKLSSRTSPPQQIECLACNTVRVVYGIRHDQTGECPACGYVGWAYSDDLDGWTRRAIVNGRLAVPPGARHHRPRPLR